MSSESKVVLATGGTLLIAILMLAALAISDHRDLRAELRSESSRQDARLLALEARMDRGFQAIEERFRAIEERFQTMENRFESRFARIEERMDRILEAVVQNPETAAAEEDVSLPGNALRLTNASSVTPVPGADLVILAGEPRPSTGWIGKSGGGP